MPIIHSVEQGSLEWFRARLGKPTASEFSKILTAGGKRSRQSEGYMARLLAEMMVGHSIQDGAGTQWMQHGKETELEAVRAYSFQTDCTTEAVGFVTNDAGTIGASPDRLVGDNGLLEIKCPAPHTHIGYLLTHQVEEDYYPQLQGQLYVCKREWTDIVSYHPEMPPAVIRVERDEKYIALLAIVLDEFVSRMAEARFELEARYGKFPDPLAGSAPMQDECFISDAEIEAIVAQHEFKT